MSTRTMVRPLHPHVAPTEADEEDVGKERAGEGVPLLENTIGGLSRKSFPGKILEIHVTNRLPWKTVFGRLSRK